MDIEQTLDHGLLNEITTMIGGLNELYRQSAEFLKSEVDYVIRHGITNPQAVEGLLDQLLDCVACDEGRLQFKRLLRHYHPVDPECVKFYVDAYHDMYEDPSARTEE